MKIDTANAAAPGLLRRLAAIFYDAWLVAAIVLLGAMLDTLARAMFEAHGFTTRLPLQAYLLLAPAFFFAWFWTHGGQTLGMRAWRLQLVAVDGGEVGWPQAWLRVGGAWLSLLCLGLGYLWIWIDPERLAWHDRLSGTRLVIRAKE
jgi:uncharacterized RDD family membrane protein YckC